MQLQDQPRDSRLLEYFLSALSALMLIAVPVAAIHNNPAIFHLKFHPLAIPAAAAAIANTVLLILINRRRGKIASSFWFSLFLGSLIYWGVTHFFQYLSADGPTVIFWAGMTNIGGTFAPMLGLLFVISYTRPKLMERSIFPWIGIFFTALLIHSVAVTTPLFEDLNPMHYNVEPYGLQMILLDPGLLLWFGWIQLMLLTNAVLLVLHYRKQTDPIEKQRARLFVIGIMIVVVVGSVTDVTFPELHIFEYVPRMGLLLTTVMAMFFGYGLLRYKLFVINPATVAPNILATMTEAVVVTDSDYRILFTNPQAERLLRKPEYYQAGASFLRTFSPELQSRMQTQVGQTLQQDAETSFDDVALATRDATYVDISASTITDESGTVSGIVWVLSDISKLKDANAQLAADKANIEQKVVERTEELQVEHARLKTSVENLPAGFFLTGPDDEIVTYNKTALTTLGITSDETMRQRLYHDLNLSGPIATCKKQRKTLDVGEVTYGDKWLHISIAPILYEDGSQPAGVIILLQDVTQARKLDEERKQFIVTSSHEMRTPIAIIEAALSTAANPSFGKLDPHVKEFLDKAHEQALHLGELFRDLDSVAALVNDEQHPTVKTFDVVELARSVANEFEGQAKEHGLALRLTCPPHSVWALADAGQIRDVLTRLTENAIKFTEKGSVEVIVESNTNQIVVRVKDTGSGIAAADQAKLFKQFGRVHNELTREVGGTGLGLYIAHSLVQLNGGHLEVESSSGQGATFSFTLTRSDQTDSASDHPPKK